MKRKISIMLVLLCVLALSGCGQKISYDEYDTKGIISIGFSSEMADMLFEDRKLIAESEKLFSSMSENLLLSFVVDSSIEISKELGKYDHLIMTNPRWIERFAQPDKLREVEYDSLSESMRTFLEAQMPLLTADGSILPDGVGLYEYDGDGLFAFPVNVTFNVADPVVAQNPLIILIDTPEETLKANGCLLPLASSGNLLFTDEEKIRTQLEKCELNSYVQIHILGEDPE